MTFCVHGFVKVTQCFSVWPRYNGKALSVHPCRTSLNRNWKNLKKCTPLGSF